MPFSPQENSHKVTVLGYLLFFLGILFGVTALIGVLISHSHFKQAHNSYLHSHLLMQIMAFWLLTGIAIAVFLLWPSSLATALIVVGISCWLATLVIGIYYLRRQQCIPFIATQNKAVSS